MPQAGEHIFLAEIEASPQPGPYADAISASKQAGTEYRGIEAFDRLGARMARAAYSREQSAAKENAPAMSRESWPKTTPIS